MWSAPQSHSANTVFLATATTTASIVLLIRYVFPQFLVWDSLILTTSATYLSLYFSWIFYTIIVWPRFVSPLRHLPTVPGGTLLAGQWVQIMKRPSGIPMREWANSIPNDGLIRYLHLFGAERVLVTGPKALAEILNTKSYDFIKPTLLRQGVARILGMGILFAEGDEHKAQRRNFMPAFNFRHIKELYPIFWSKSQEMTKAIEAQSNLSQLVEVGEWASRATLDIIGTAGLGQDFNALQNPDSELNMTYRRIFQPSRAAQILGILSFFIPGRLLSLLPIKRNADMLAASNYARSVSRQLVEQKKRQMAEKVPPQADIISVALESGGFTDAELVDNMMTFLAAGHETTASAFTWCVYHLCQNLDMQSQLRAEIHAALPNGLGSPIDSTLIDSLPYLHGVVMETLRVHSPVPLTIRDTALDTSLQGHVIPKGTKIIMAPWATNLSKDLWGADADEFKPARWTGPGKAGNGGATSNYAFLTFLHGPRSCIGSKFATAELACLVATFVGAWEFSMPDPNMHIDIKGGITARPRDGLNVQLKRVEGW